jgi:hypothetical protein
MRYTGTCRRSVLLAGIGLCAAVVLSACAAPGALPGGSQSEAEMLPLDDSLLVEDQLGEELALPPVDLETMEWLDRLQGELTGTQILVRPRSRMIEALSLSPGLAHLVPGSGSWSPRPRRI